MRRNYFVVLCMSAAILTSTILSPAFSETKPINDLGKMTLSSEKVALDFYTNLLKKETPGAYTATISHGNINLEASMLTATKMLEQSPYYFKPESQFGGQDEPDLYYVEKADLVINTVDGFNQFLAKYEGQNIPDQRIKLLNYAENGGYPYKSHTSLNSLYSVKDKAIYGGAYIRTIKRYILSDVPPAKTYTVSTEAELKTALTESVNAFQEKIMLISANGISAQAIQNMLDQLHQTSVSPQFDFYRGFYVITQANVHTLQIYYDYDSETCKALLADAKSKASEIVATRVTPNMDDYAAAKLLHDYLLETVRYDEFAYRFDLDDQRIHDFTGAFFDQAAVCSGYASAYRMLLDAAGIENYYVSGTGQAYATAKKDHAWNIIKLGSHYYHVDSTWDDQTASILQHRYFALSDAQFLTDHTWNRALYPICDDGSLEYFTRNQLIFDSLKALDNFAQTQLKNGVFSFGFKSTTLSSNQIKAEMTKLLNQLFPDGYSFTFSRYDNIYDYHITPKGSIMLPSSDPVIRGLNLNDLCINNGTFMAVGDKGQLLRSKDGTKWTLLPKITDKNLLSIAYGNRYYLAAGEAGTLLLSADGVRFNTYASPTKLTIKRAVFQGGKFWLLGEKGFMASSANGIKWTKVSTGTTYGLNDLIYAKGQYTAVGQHGTLLTSKDGAKWTVRKTGISTELKSIAYGGGYYLTGGSSSILLKSSDSINWRQIYYNNKLLFNRIIFANGAFLAVGNEQRMVIQPNNTYTYIAGRPLLNSVVSIGKNVYVVGDKGQLYMGENGSIQVLWQLSLCCVV